MWKRGTANEENEGSLVVKNSLSLSRTLFTLGSKSSKPHTHTQRHTHERCKKKVEHFAVQDYLLYNSTTVVSTVVWPGEERERERHFAPKHREVGKSRGQIWLESFTPSSTGVRNVRKPVAISGGQITLDISLSHTHTIIDPTIWWGNSWWRFFSFQASTIEWHTRWCLGSGSCFFPHKWCVCVWCRGQHWPHQSSCTLQHWTLTRMMWWRILGEMVGELNSLVQNTGSRIRSTHTH